MIRVEEITAAQAEAALAGLIRLLQQVVDDGASIGFLAPLSVAEAREYWLSTLPAIVQGNKLLFVAKLDDPVAGDVTGQGANQGASQIIGAVQLALEPRANGSHRAEVQKLMVHPAQRGLGVGRQLMAALEATARAQARSLLVLDTRCGDAAERLYQQLGYQLAGTIPHYARSSDGNLHDTVFYYRQL